MPKYVYAFTEGDGKNKSLLGSKGANLCEMTQIGLNVPPGFVITTEACQHYLTEPDQGLPTGLMEEVKTHIEALEKLTGKNFGDPDNPLLVSVRSGAAVSMPGMMDTILDLGLNRHTLQGLIKQTDNPRFGYDSYRRFIHLFGRVALNIPDEDFSHHLELVKQRLGITDVSLGVKELQEIGEYYRNTVEENTGAPFPEDVYEQLEIAIQAVFKSWLSKRAQDYRAEFNITPEQADGTAVSIVRMVFGNMGNDSATGVGFTRSPATGTNELYGEYLVNAQGEDVVAGIRTPNPVQQMSAEMPEQYEQLETLRHKLEAHYHEVQDFEYTIESGVLYCLQTRTAQMSTVAMVKTSVDLVNEDLITKEQSLLRITSQHLEQLLHPRLDPHGDFTPLTKGLAASPGAACGECTFDADHAETLSKNGHNIILIREETRPEDIHGFFAAQGILTSRGGKTSHAAVVARSMGKPCVAGAERMTIDTKMRQAVIGDYVLREGDIITIDGSTGNVYPGEIPTIPPKFSEELHTLLDWADDIAQLQVMANADTPVAAERAAEYGAKGIGLCRTERMFNAADRLPVMVEMILARTPLERQTALSRLLPMQRSDFKNIFKVISPNPVTIRLLDPPMHEFLPSEQELVEEIERLKQLRGTVQGINDLMNTMRMLQQQAGQLPSPLPTPFGSLKDELVDDAVDKKEQMLRKVRELQEVNPMLGHRGVRLGITSPEIYRMQIQAILEAAAECQKEGITVAPEVMVPQINTVQELLAVKHLLTEMQEQVANTHGVQVEVKFGTMIEVVRACMLAGKLAEVTEFFSFGTNDLTQATFSFSREDAENKFLPAYTQMGILDSNPFEVLDVQGVGQLMSMAVEWGRKARGGLKVGICGEHGGHPESIRFCHHIDLDYVSCSPPRVPIARLAAAHAKLQEDKYVLDD